MMTTEEETWEQKEEPGGGGGGGGIGEDTPEAGSPSREVGQREPDEQMLEDEEEDLPVLKVVLPPPDAPRKEHVNVVFIGHVGMFLG